MISSPLISPDEAISLIGQAVFLDVRVGPNAAAAHQAAHVRGAIPVDIESDLSNVRNPTHGGRHPLPPLDRWLGQLGEWGVTPSTPVIVYDAAGAGMAAARAWWMLRAIGHESLAVVDGGWQALRGANVPVEEGNVRPHLAGPYSSKIDHWPTVDATFVERICNDSSWRLIDARAPERYAGKVEPLDPVAGHIPGAQNLYWKSQLDEQGMFDSPSRLQERYAPILGDVPPDRVVCYCGSGVTACHLLLAMHVCGLAGARLYVGSWSEWCRQDRPRAPE